jgi:hypothetical protein
MPLPNEEMKIKLDRIVKLSYRDSPRTAWIKCLVCGNKENANFDLDKKSHSLSNPPQRWGSWLVMVPEHPIRKNWLGLNKKDSPICETSGKFFRVNIFPPKDYPKSWYEHDLKDYHPK